MSAIRGLPHSPEAARLYGAWRRSGQETTATEECSKLEERPADMGETSSSREGALSSSF